MTKQPQPETAAQSQNLSETLTLGQRNDATALQCIGWTEGDGTGHEGYQWQDYFRDGVYLGPDEHGIEPRFIGTGETRESLLAAIAVAGYRDMISGVDEESRTITLAVLDTEADELIERLRPHVVAVEYAGTSNTDAEGDTTEDIFATY